MASVIRLSNFGKIVALTGLGGSFYLLRNEISPYIKSRPPQEPPYIDKMSQTPKTIDNLPEKVPYLLVGGGTASHSAMRSIRGHDPKAKVLIIGSENYSPYMRPALSKELWFTEQELRRDLNFRWWNGKERSIFYEIDEFFIPIENLAERETGGVSFLRNTRLTRLDPDNRVAHLENGQTISYDKCLLATGGKPRTLPALNDAPEEIQERVVYFRTADDFLKLENIAETAKKIVIIGGGFLGSELTCALSQRLPKDKIPENQVIYQIFSEHGNLGQILPRHLSDWLSKKIESDGAKVIPDVEIKSVRSIKNNQVELTLSNNETICADYIVCAIGIQPEVELAKSSGLEVDEKIGGYLVNSELEARSSVWVAGDASCFYDTKLGRRRVEHHDHAIHSGRLAGQNMVGAGKTYSHQPMFWSDLGTDISFEAVGIIDSSLPTISVFTHPDEPDTSPHIEGAPEVAKQSENDKYNKGVIFYMRDDVIVGVLLWNIFSRLKIARRILHEQKKYDDLTEVAKLFNIYLDE